MDSGVWDHIPQHVDHIIIITIIIAHTCRLPVFSCNVATVKVYTSTSSVQKPTSASYTCARKEALPVTVIDRSKHTHTPGCMHMHQHTCMFRHPHTHTHRHTWPCIRTHACIFFELPQQGSVPVARPPCNSPAEKSCQGRGVHPSLAGTSPAKAAQAEVHTSALQGQGRSSSSRSSRRSSCSLTSASTVASCQLPGSVP